ncbi:hypothetical protein PM082_007386 [Marasmius tenuissimus]|nr:hypothetical protein PM082_007386 [Marasmius tenuissimus]
MPAIPDDQLLQYADRAKGKVVVVTGGGNGIGKETAVRFAGFGAKVVIGDIDLGLAEANASSIRSTGGEAIATKCDVTVWNELVDMYEAAMREFGAVDIVVANAGIGEVGGCCKFPIQVDENGRPEQPGVRTIEVNLVGTLYTVHLAQHYLTLKRESTDSLKAIVLLGSIASWIALPMPTIMYVASKHGVLGVMRALDKTSFRSLNIRISCICPFYAETPLVPTFLKELFEENGIPLVPVPRIAGAIIHSATHPDPSTSGGAYWVPGPGSSFFVSREEFKEGVYEVIDEYSNAQFKRLSNPRRPEAGGWLKSLLPARFNSSAKL